MKFEIWPPYLKKNVKIGTLSWRSMENSSRPNSGTVRRIQFKLGTGIDQPSVITWHDSKGQRSRSQGHIMYIAKICLNSVYGGPITSYSEVDFRTTPTSRAQNHSHGNTGCLAMGPRNLHFMIKYIKNAKYYKLQQWHISPWWGPDNVTQFLWK